MSTAITPALESAMDDEGIYDEDGLKKTLTSSKVWARLDDNNFVPVPASVPHLKSGVYKIVNTNQGVRIQTSEIKADALIADPDEESKTAMVTSEIKEFWGRADVFNQMGLLHRRGYLLYGPPGTGKSCLLKQLSDNLTATGGITIVVSSVSLLTIGLALIRSVEPTRKIMCIFEDVENFVSYDESRFLSYLDGEDQVQHVVNIGTTNHIDRLPPRVKERPRRFDRPIEVAPPSESMRRVYLTAKLAIAKKSAAEIDQWVKLTKGFTFAAMTDLITSVCCLGKNLNDSVTAIKTLLKVQTF